MGVYRKRVALAPWLVERAADQSPLEMLQIRPPERR
jgi:hypothetical protein